MTMTELRHASRRSWPPRDEVDDTEVAEVNSDCVDFKALRRGDDRRIDRSASEIAVFSDEAGETGRSPDELGWSAPQSSNP